ncbi:MAG: hypothetical protein N3B18_11675 [Desulfobacterota bacterium]|nr:hypothetical protein [Thermodesulfobacteriota bacterium]
MTNRCLAAIDIGSQTIRLLVAQIKENGCLIPLYRDRAIVRLGEGMHVCAMLQPRAIDRAVACIEDFVNKARARQAVHIFSVCTACVRMACNAHEFLERVHKATKIMPRVVSGDEEARLSLRGVLSVLERSITHVQPLLVIDIGGGSTECAYVINGKLHTAISLPIGVITLTDKHIAHDPPTLDELRALEHDIETQLGNIGLLEQACQAHCILAGTAGTATTLAAMDLQMSIYDPERINGYRLSLQAVESLWALLTTLPRARRIHLQGLEPGRETVIISGTALVRAFMRSTDTSEMIISDAGLLEGILLDYALPQT